MAAAGLVQLPGILLLGGVVVVLVALLPRWAAPLSWALLVAALVLGPMFGPTLGLPQWAQDLSPFTNIPKAPATDVTAAPRRRPGRDLPCPRGGRGGGDPPAESHPPRLRRPSGGFAQLGGLCTDLPV